MGRRTASVVAGAAILAGLAVLYLLQRPRSDVGTEGTPDSVVTAAAAPGEVGPTTGAGAEARPGAAPTPWLGAPPRPAVATPAAAAPEPSPPAGPPPPLTGTVVTDDWFRVPDVEVLLTLERPVRTGSEVRLAGRVVARARTDAEGGFSFASVPDDEFHLAVLRATHPRGGYVAPRYVTVPAALVATEVVARRAEDVTIRLLGRPTTWVRIVDSDGSPLADARVLVSGSREPVETDADGWAPLPADVLARDPAREVRVEPPRGRPDLEAVEGPLGSSTIELSRGRTVTGTIVDAEGRPAPRARLRYAYEREDGAQERAVSAREDGTFVLGGLHGESVTLWAGPEGADLAGGDCVTARVPVGSADVRLAFPPLGDVRITVAGVGEGASVVLRAEVADGGTEEPPAAPERRDVSFTVPETYGVGWIVRFTEAGGHVTFRSVRSDRTYLAWMMPDAEGRTFVLAGLHASGRDVVATAQRGLPTTVRAADEGWVVERAWALDDRGVLFEAQRAGRGLRFPALPAGTWQVVARLVESSPWFNDGVEDRRGIELGGGRVKERRVVRTRVVAGAEAVIEPPR